MRGEDGAVDDALQQLLGRPTQSPPLAALRLRILDDEVVRSECPGAVTSTALISLETLLPAPHGLFCEQIFGALEDAHGAHGDKAARMRALDGPFLHGRDDDIVKPRVRTERFGHIALPLEIEHPLASRPGWRAALERAGVPEWNLRLLPVLPPDLRPIVPIVQPADDGKPALRFAVSDLNDLYRFVLHAAIRLGRLTELRAPPSILDIETMRLGEAVAQLFDNRATAEPRLGASGRPLVGLWEMLARPERPLWPTLAELDGMVARGVVRALQAPLARRSFAVIAYLRGLGIAVEIAQPAEHDPATVH
jgi:DNA-directed RNA polymerase beta' subunit